MSSEDMEENDDGDYKSGSGAGVSALAEATPQRWGDGAEGRTTKGGNEWWGKWLREVGEMAIDEADDSVCATARARIGLPDDPGCCAPFYTRF